MLVLFVCLAVGGLVCFLARVRRRRHGLAGMPFMLGARHGQVGPGTNKDPTGGSERPTDDHPGKSSDQAASPMGIFSVSDSLDSLRARYPLLRDASICISQGWGSLLEGFAQSVTGYAHRHGLQGLRLKEVNSKGGCISIVLSGDYPVSPPHSRALRRIARLAERESAKTCELCGAPGHRHRIRNRLSTVCEKCARKSSKTGRTQFAHDEPGDRKNAPAEPTRTPSVAYPTLCPVPLRKWRIFADAWFADNLPERYGQHLEKLGRDVTESLPFSDGDLCEVRYDDNHLLLVFGDISPMLIATLDELDDSLMRAGLPPAQRTTLN